MDVLEAVKDDRTSILALTRDRILDGIIGAVDSPFKVLVLDQHSTKIISAACTMTDITSSGISLVEALEKGRQPLPRMDAIYFITPTEKSINLMLKDFENPNASLYKAAHLFFTDKLEDRLLSKIGQSRAINKIHKCVEANIDFHAFERKVFHLNMPAAFRHIYASVDPKKYHAEVARKIVSMCATLGENPVVRYSRTNPNNSSIAGMVADGLEELKQSNSSRDTHERGTLLIIDRAYDILTPFIHEFTYQAMVTDILQVDRVFKHKFNTSDGEEEQKDVLLDESDPIWTSMAHMHIEHGRKWVAAAVKEFLEKSKSGREVSEKKDKSTKALSELVRSVPKYQKLYAKFSLHITLAKKAMDEFNRSNLEKLCMVEQDVACGTNQDGRRLAIDSLIDAVQYVMSDAEINKEDRLRLLLLLFATVEEKDESKLKKLIAGSKLSNSDENLVKAVSQLKSATSRKDQRRNPAKDEWEFVLSRYFPAVKDLYDKLANVSLDAKEFPFASKDDEKVGSSGTPSAAASKRTQGADKAKGKATAKDTPKASRKASKRIIIFITGGATYSELREAYAATETHKLDCIIGSTHIVRPTDWIKMLRSLNDASANNEDSDDDDDDANSRPSSPRGKSMPMKKAAKKVASDSSESDERPVNRAPAKKAAARRGPADSDSDSDSDSSDDRPAKRAPAKRAPVKKTAAPAKRTARPIDSDSDSSDDEPRRPVKVAAKKAVPVKKAK